MAGVVTNATKQGSDFILNGQKTFITNGINADVVIVVCKTKPEKGAHGISLLIVEVFFFSSKNGLEFVVSESFH